MDSYEGNPAGIKGAKPTGAYRVSLSPKRVMV